MNNKWKNYGLWVSIISTVSLAFTEFLPSNFEAIGNSLLSTLVVLGIISNPSQGQGYIDEE